ncbi:MAG: aminotransferase class I/II-fold pyridoxal phosphate-dependent enzyme [Lachnospiraceae bacterium]|nr:aminotransferase class I/II-fold pyridoxal phosphate-dependent enzyme [Lachnospiraceae bacterium]
MEGIHGGDVYRNRVKIDFSVNINPLGMPEDVEAALHEAVKNCSRYPDITARRLKKAVSGMLDVPEQFLLFGNGASELFLAAVHAIRPEKTVILVPSFYGYEYAAGAVDGEILYYETREEEGFCPREDLFSLLTEDVGLLFLANPNNPTGKVIPGDMLKALCIHCRDRGIVILLDECFIEFCSGDVSMLGDIGAFDNLILVRAFTKSFSIPGVRLGYLVCSNRQLLGKLQRQLPEWNVSGFAQAAGAACAKQEEFLRKTAEYIRKERQFLADGLKQYGMTVFEGEANFLLVYSKQDWYADLLKRGILIRDCENFRGLSKGFYRIAVKGRAENETLLKEMGEIYG